MGNLKKKKMNAKTFVALFVLAVAASAVHKQAAKANMSAPYAADSGYTPDTGIYDNPATDVKPIATLPEAPRCTVTPETVSEVHKMRAAALQIKNQVDFEVHNMEKRKAYVEQMTSYLNDRIRELNKVKASIAQEEKFVALGKHRMTKLSHQENLVKVSDVIKCLENEGSNVKKVSADDAKELAGLKKKETAIKGKIDAVAKEMAKSTTPK